MIVPIIKGLLVKLTSRCNLKCTYCYWFKDEDVLNQPKSLTKEAEETLMVKLKEHLIEYKLDKFNIIFHGGEPLLFGKKRFINFVLKLKELEIDTNCSFNFGLTTNGVLIDEDWAKIFKSIGLHVTVSVDGPKEIHDYHRKDHKGKGSYDRTVQGINILREFGNEPTVLAVCNPESDPKKVLENLIDQLELKFFDILIPQATYEEKPISVSDYYKRLFTFWYDSYVQKGVNVRFLKAVIKGLLGGNTKLDSIGYGPVTTVTILPDGSIEPLDVLRIAGNGSTKTSFDIFKNNIKDITEDPLWKEAYHASLNLHENCRNCVFMKACGGGYLPNRWSNSKRYDNPSVYCADLKDIFDHVWTRISKDLYIQTEDKSIKLYKNDVY